jgi:hypothetical protein
MEVTATHSIANISFTRITPMEEKNIFDYPLKTGIFIDLAVYLTSHFVFGRMDVHKDHECCLWK